MYNVNFGGSFGAAQPMDETLWADVPGTDYKTGKFITEAYEDPETGELVQMEEQVKAVEVVEPPVAGEEAANVAAAALKAEWAAQAAALAARGVKVGAAQVEVGCDGGLCIVRGTRYVPVRTWVSRQLFDNEEEAQAHAAETKAMLEAAGWNVVDSDVSREETGWFHVLHEVDVTPLYLALEEPGEGETIMPPIIGDEEETLVIPAASAMTRGQKIGLGIGIGVGAAVLIGGIATAVVMKKRNESEAPAMAGYGYYRRPMAGYSRRPRGHYRKPLERR